MARRAPSARDSNLAHRSGSGQASLDFFCLRTALRNALISAVQRPAGRQRAWRVLDIPVGRLHARRRQCLSKTLHILQVEAAVSAIAAYSGIQIVIRAVGRTAYPELNAATPDALATAFGAAWGRAGDVSQGCSFRDPCEPPKCLMPADDSCTDG